MRLYGLKQIADVVGRSEDTVKRLITRYGLPACKIGGRWESDSERLERWRETHFVWDDEREDEKN